MRDGERHRAGILHGRRAGRPLRAAQRAAIDRLLPVLAIDIGGLDHPEALFRRPVGALRIEIGFGGGEHLAAEALRLPETGFIGCEPFRNGVAKLSRQVEDLGLDNLRIHAGDAGEVLDALPEGALAQADIFYPDPWPKRRQRKRRFVSDDNLARLARALRPRGLLRFATDIDDYAGWVLARVLRSPDFLWIAEAAEDWRRPWPHWPSTRYEAKAIRDGRRPVYLTMRRR